ncbi:MAG: protein YgfX [Pseudomonadota bacterium]|nr:protein YgfX [Pseudomonadota bacterium]
MPGFEGPIYFALRPSASLAATPYVTRKITVLPLKLDDGTVKRVVLLPDGTDPDAFRRLRVRLRFNVA